MRCENDASSASVVFSAFVKQGYGVDIEESSRYTAGGDTLGQLDLVLQPVNEFLVIRSRVPNLETNIS